MSESGPFYGTLVDPILKPMRKRVAEKIHATDSVIDIACGTGAQVFEIAKIAKSVIGVDYSISMINYAQKATKKHKLDNVQFLVCDATNLSEFANKQFEFAVMTMALHQFSPEYHSPILDEMKRVAKKIILVDYAVPLPTNYAGIGSKVAEFLAGKEHNKNFKSYGELGGLNKILINNNLQIEESEFFAKGAFQLIVCMELAK